MPSKFVEVTVEDTIGLLAAAVEAPAIKSVAGLHFLK